MKANTYIYAPKPNTRTDLQTLVRIANIWTKHILYNIDTSIYLYNNCVQHEVILPLNNINTHYNTKIQGTITFHVILFHLLNKSDKYIHWWFGNGYQ